MPQIKLVVWDFDNTLWWQVKTQLEFLMERFNLSPFYVFETEKNIDVNGEEYGNYNCVSLSKVRFFETFQIQTIEENNPRPRQKTRTKEHTTPIKRTTIR